MIFCNLFITFTTVPWEKIIWMLIRSHYININDNTDNKIVLIIINITILIPTKPMIR